MVSAEFHPAHHMTVQHLVLRADHGLESRGSLFIRVCVCVCVCVQWLGISGTGRTEVDVQYVYLYRYSVQV